MCISFVSHYFFYFANVDFLKMLLNAIATIEGESILKLPCSETTVLELPTADESYIIYDALEQGCGIGFRDTLNY